jgi:hypothetical protein
MDRLFKVEKEWHDKERRIIANKWHMPSATTVVYAED